MRHNAQLSPNDVKEMGLAEFEARFGFRPTDALDKWAFAMQGIRISADARDAMEAGVIEKPDLSGIVME